MKSLIASQGPVEKSIIKFWQMIWENKVGLIAMLCPLIGPKEKEECTNYWKDAEANGVAEIGEYFVLKMVSKSTLNEERIIHRKFELVLIQKQKIMVGEFEKAESENEELQSLIIDHYHLIGWEDDTAKKEENVFVDVETILEKML